MENMIPLKYTYFVCSVVKLEWNKMMPSNSFNTSRPESQNAWKTSLLPRGMIGGIEHRSNGLVQCDTDWKINEKRKYQNWIT